jgi:hypothetical protein
MHFYPPSIAISVAFGFLALSGVPLPPLGGLAKTAA